MVDIINKYSAIIRSINGYDEAMQCEKNNYSRELKAHPADFVKIGVESNQREDAIVSERLSKLKKEFPNVEFSKNDIELLSNKYTEKQENSDIINNIQLKVKSQTNYGGRAVSSEEREKMYNAKLRSSKLESRLVNAYISFFELCEKLNTPETLKNPEFDFEGEIFNRIYDHEFSIRPQDQILKKYYETYKLGRDKEKENKELFEENSMLVEKVDQVNEENEQLKNENEALKQRSTKLQKMLGKTLKFCDRVRGSRFGQFFFRKEIKELPRPKSDGEER